jgi:hypothetical protein
MIINTKDAVFRRPNPNMDADLSDLLSVEQTAEAKLRGVLLSH